MSIDSKGNRLAVGLPRNGTVIVYDLNTGVESDRVFIADSESEDGTNRGQQTRVTCVRFNSSGSRLAVGLCREWNQGLGVQTNLHIFDSSGPRIEPDGIKPAER
jgi:WD40 repeat protein